MKLIFTLGLTFTSLISFADETKQFELELEGKTVKLTCFVERSTHCPGPGRWNCISGHSVNFSIPSAFFRDKDYAINFAEKINRSIQY